MTWATCYIPPTNTLWQGRGDIPDASCFFQIMQMLNLLEPVAKPGQPAFGLIGFCCDEGVSRNLGRKGAAEGPDAVRGVLAKMPVQRQHFLCLDAGDIACVDGDLEQAQAALGEAVARLLHYGITPIVMGGGHELAWGHYQGIARKHGKQHLGIINFDAHFDMRPMLPENRGSSGTPFLQIAQAHASEGRRLDYNCIGIQRAGNIPLLFATAKKYHAHMLLADDVHQGSRDSSEKFISRIIHDNDILYLSLCLDVFASAYAPGVSAPQPLGLTPWQVIPMVRQLAQSGKVVSYDIAELSPPHDRDHRTARLAANFIFEIIHHHKI